MKRLRNAECGMRNEWGHSFIELIIVLSLLGILVAVVTPTSDVQQGSLDAFSHRLRSDLHYAQEMAMTTGAAYGFRSIDATTYEIFSPAPGTPAIDPFKRTQFVISVQDFYKNVQFSGNQPTVTFTSTGAPTIVNGPNIVITNGTANKTIVVTPNTGVAVIQ